MSIFRNLISGAVGALSLNALHETASHSIPNAPRVDVIGMRALSKPLHWLGYSPSPARLRRMTFAGDLISNTLYYAFVGKSVRRAAVLGVLAGVGAVVLPPKMGLGQQPSRNFPVTAALTVAWYTFGAFAALVATHKLEAQSAA